MDSTQGQSVLPAAEGARDCYLQLGRYQKGDYSPGASLLCRMVWYVVNECIFRSGWFPFASIKSLLLRLFGASVGAQVVVRLVPVEPLVRLDEHGVPTAIAAGLAAPVGRRAGTRLCRIFPAG